MRAPANIPMCKYIVSRDVRVALAYERPTNWHTMNPTLDENLKKLKTDAAGQVGRAGHVGLEGPAGEGWDW